MGLAEIELLKRGHKVNMVDISDKALDSHTRSLIGEKLTYTLCPLEALPEDFPIAEWGICINVLMTVDPAKLDSIMRNMRRTCWNLIIETYDMNDMRLGRQMKGDMSFWTQEMSKYWPVVRPFKRSGTRQKINYYRKRNIRAEIRLKIPRLARNISPGEVFFY